MKLRLKIPLAGLWILTFGTIANAGQLSTQLIQSSRSFCIALGWQFDDSKIQIRRLKPALGTRSRVTDGEVSLILNEDPIYVRIASNGRLANLRRWSSPNVGNPAFSGEAAWVAHAKNMLLKVLPNVALSKTRFHEVLLQEGPTPMQRSNANTALVNFRIGGPTDLFGDEVTIIMDRANGKVLKYSYLKKR